MTQPTPTERGRPERRTFLWALAGAAPLAAAGALLVLAVDTGGAELDGVDSAIVALVTGADSAEAHIVSMPLVWVVRALVVVSLVVDVFLFRYLFSRGRQVE